MNLVMNIEKWRIFIFTFAVYYVYLWSTWLLLVLSILFLAVGWRICLSKGGFFKTTREISGLFIKIQERSVAFYPSVRGLSGTYHETFDLQFSRFLLKEKYCSQSYKKLSQQQLLILDMFIIGSIRYSFP